MSDLREYAIAAYFRIFLPHISRLHGPHILKKISAFFWHPYAVHFGCQVFKLHGKCNSRLNLTYHFLILWFNNWSATTFVFLWQHSGGFWSTHDQQTSNIWLKAADTSVARTSCGGCCSNAECWLHSTVASMEPWRSKLPTSLVPTAAAESLGMWLMSSYSAT